MRSVCSDYIFIYKICIFLCKHIIININKTKIKAKSYNLRQIGK